MRTRHAGILLLSLILPATVKAHEENTTNGELNSEMYYLLGAVLLILLAMTIGFFQGKAMKAHTQKGEMAGQ